MKNVNNVNYQKNLNTYHCECEHNVFLLCLRDVIEAAQNEYTIHSSHITTTLSDGPDLGWSQAATCGRSGASGTSSHSYAPWTRLE